ncbi:hypothetical protein U0070_006345 [Myodes glareolus]|uniref:Large ribosomal subunit protein uL15/eL18 domain-containing protein n=1 Tax=Myodes glareolus TaxID=447135 RepID=A0AAW0I0F1_MYOGA
MELLTFAPLIPSSLKLSQAAQTKHTYKTPASNHTTADPMDIPYCLGCSEKSTLEKQKEDLAEQEAPSWVLTSATRTERRKESKGQDIHLRLLVKLYRFLARRTNSTFNQDVLKRLFMSRTNRPPLSLSRMIQKMKLPGRENKTAVVVGTVTDDVRILDVPKLKACALWVSSRAQGPILKTGGKILTFNQLALESPKRRGTVFLSGPHKSREVYRHFGKAPGTPQEPYIRSKGRKFERARGRRASRGYKN